MQIRSDCAYAGRNRRLRQLPKQSKMDHDGRLPVIHLQCLKKEGCPAVDRIRGRKGAMIIILEKSLISFDCGIPRKEIPC